MSRLIDADELIKKLSKISAFEYVRNSADKNVFEIISEQPTANVDKNVRAEAYNKGLEDAWELARKLYTMDCDTISNIFSGCETELDVIKNYTPQEALAKLEAYEKTKEIKVGDVIESVNTGRLGIITMLMENAHYVLFMDGSAGVLAHNEWKKTDKHIDIQSVLQQIGGVE